MILHVWRQWVGIFFQAKLYLNLRIYCCQFITLTFGGDMFLCYLLYECPTHNLNAPRQKLQRCYHFAVLLCLKVKKIRVLGVYIKFNLISISTRSIQRGPIFLNNSTISKGSFRFVEPKL